LECNKLVDIAYITCPAGKNL
nr:RecName: Full=7.2 kDa cytotoxin RVV-7 [Daboia russelii]